MTEPVAYLNGRWIPASAAAVPVGDAGFVLGATAAEQLRTFAGKLFRLDKHLARLRRSLDILGLEPELSQEQLASLACEIVERNHPLLAPGDDLGLSIFVTPGGYPAYSPPGTAKPLVCLHTYPLPFHLWADKYRSGQALATTEIMQPPSQCWPPELKCRSRVHYYLADRQARLRDPQARALLFDADGFASEASTANLLIYRQAEGLISPRAEKILPGISLAAVADIARELGIPTSHRDLTAETIAAADEVWLTSTPICLLPVVRFNRQPIADGNPGELFRRVLAAWSEKVGVDIAAQAATFQSR